MPNSTVAILPTGVIAVKSPNPIVVTTANEYHKPSVKELILSSKNMNTNEQAIIIVIKPKIISKAKVLKIIWNNVLNFNVEKALDKTSIRAVKATMKQTTIIGAYAKSPSNGKNNPIANKVNIAMIIELRIILLLSRC